jgi:hypothetical protein
LQKQQQNTNIWFGVYKIRLYKSPIPLKNETRAVVINFSIPYFITNTPFKKTAAPIAIANPAKCMETLPSNHIDSEIFAGNCLNTP